MKLLKKFVPHPFLFAAYPVLFLFAHNADQLAPDSVAAPLAASLAFTLAAWLLMSLLACDVRKGALVVSLFILLFFSYGHLHVLLKGLPLLGRKRYFAAVLAAAFVALTVIILRSRRDLGRLTSFINLAAAVLATIALGQGVIGYLGQSSVVVGKEGSPAGTKAATTLPDIYYIILDKYARQDILGKVYNFDNSDFLDFLKAKGFYVAERTAANYCQTYISMASSLNSVYLDEVVKMVGETSRDKTPLIAMIRKSSLVDELRRRGYLFVNVSSGYEPTELTEADIYLSPGWAPNEFEDELINMTPVGDVLDKLQKKSRFQLHRERILYAFDQIPGVAKLKRPTFLFAHIVSPHPPFVFDKDGKNIPHKGPFSFQGREYSRKHYIQLYRGQLAFTNKKLKEMIDGILDNSPEPPVIILQADHGPGNMTIKTDVDMKTFNVKERMAILNAYYLPGGGRDLLYPSITPVNSFRLVLDHYFGAGYKLLEDRCYFSQYRTPYKFIDVTERIGAGDSVKQ